MTRPSVDDQDEPAGADDPLRLALRRVLDESFAVSGAVVGTADGLLLAAEFRGAEPRTVAAHPESVAALAAATSGVAGQFGRLVPIGDTSATIVQGSRGCVAVQPLDPSGVLVLYGTGGSTAARMYLAVRQALPIVEEALGTT